MDLDFEEHLYDENVVAKIKNFHDTTLKMKDTIKLAANPEIYEKLSNPEKIQYNLLMAYCLNSMFWMHLRAEGIDPMKHKVKQENERLKKLMARAKQIEEKKSLMPRLNKDAAQRFVRSGLWDAKNSNKHEDNRDVHNSNKTCLKQ